MPLKSSAMTPISSLLVTCTRSAVTVTSWVRSPAASALATRTKDGRSSPCDLLGRHAHASDGAVMPRESKNPIAAPSTSANARIPTMVYQACE